jgi:excisionase family DNA binding protein
MPSADQNTSHVSRGVTIAEAARRLGVSERTIYRYIKNGKLKTDNMSEKIRVLLPEMHEVDDSTSDSVSQISEKIRHYDEQFDRVVTLLMQKAIQQERLQLEMGRIYFLLRDTLQSNERLQQALIDLLKAKEREDMRGQSDDSSNDGRGLPWLLRRILKHDKKS